MAAVWETKWGPRRVRDDPPTLAEALAAAQGLTDDPQEQVAFAAGLMGVSEAVAKAELAKMAPDRRASRLTLVPSHRQGAVRTVVVERKASRRMAARHSGPPGSA